MNSRKNKRHPVAFLSWPRDLGDKEVIQDGPNPLAQKRLNSLAGRVVELEKLGL